MKKRHFFHYIYCYPLGYPRVFLEVKTVGFDLVENHDYTPLYGRTLQSQLFWWCNFEISNNFNYGWKNIKTKSHSGCTREI